MFDIFLENSIDLIKNKYIHVRKRMVGEKDKAIGQLIQKLEANTRVEAEVHQLQDELERTKEEAQEALMNQALSQKAMEAELIALASRNSQFQKEKEELQTLLEEATMESNQLREHVVRGRTMTNRNLMMTRDASNFGGGVSTDMGNDLEAMGMGQSSFASDEYFHDEDDYEDEVCVLLCFLVFAFVFEFWIVFFCFGII